MALRKTYSAQSALKTCTEHEHDELDLYCRTCNVPICTECLKKKHLDHDWDKIKKIAKKLRADYIRRKLEIESMTKSIDVGTNEILSNILSKNEKVFHQNTTDLESTRKTMHEIVDSTIDVMKKKCQSHGEKTKKAIQKKQGEMKPKLERLQFLLLHMEEAAVGYSDFDVIEFHDELKELLKDLGSIAMIPLDFHEETVYKKGTIEKAAILSMLGSVDRIEKPSSMMKVDSVTEFSCGENPVNSIWAVSKDEAWIHCVKTNINTLIDHKGKRKESVDIRRCYNFTMSEDGSTFFCDRWDTQSVMVLDKSMTLKTLFSPAPLIPTTISLTHSGDLLVSLVDKDTHDRTSSSRRLLRRMTKTGTVIREYEYDKDGKTPLFDKPTKSLELHNGTVCIFNESEKDADVLYGFDNCGDLKFKYSGTNNPFNPLDMCCDFIGNILVSDSINQLIHQLDSEGNFLQYLLTKQTLKLSPYAIALLENRLWISSNDKGCVKVYSILHN